MRAIDKGLTAGAHGLPLIGSGDWNDGMNRVGPAGRGESTWLGLLPAPRPQRLRAALPRTRRRRPRPTAIVNEARRARRHARTDRWDGEWYRRGYYDDGTPLGSAQNDECSIDSISAVVGGALRRRPVRFAERAMDAVRTSLVATRIADRCCCSTRPSIDRRRIPATSRAIRRASARTAASTRTRPSGSSWRSPRWAAATRPRSSSTCSTRSTTRARRRTSPATRPSRT